MKRIAFALAVCLFLLMMSGCEQARFREGGGLTQTPVNQPVAMRALVTPKGLESLYRTATPKGLWVQAEVTSLEHEELELKLGPLEQAVHVERWSVVTEIPTMQVRASLQQPTLTMALRIHDGISHQICRFSAQMDNAAIDATVSIAHPAEGPSLGVSDKATIEFDALRVRKVGSCPIDLDLEIEEGLTLTEIIEGYVSDALVRSAEEAFAASPLDMMGLIRRRVELSRLSSFESRRGQVLFIGKLSEEEPMDVSTHGLEVNLDLAMSPRRAGCAPPVSLGVPDTRPAGPLSATILNQFGADVGMALSVPVLQRLAQAMTAAGFMCHGFDDPRRDEESREVVPLDSLRLDDIGVTGIPFGPWGRTMISAGALPTVQTRPERNDVQLRLESLIVDVYGELFGVPVRLARVQATADFGLRAKEDEVGMIAFEIESVQIRDVSLRSDWLETRPREADLMNWTRRLLIMTLQDRLVMPLPIDPGTPLTLVGSQIRSTDVVLMMRFVQ
ncbi:MAG: hypothetical protein ACNA8W_01885 [Bradymonadaceae bacterium]